jgi:transposase
VKPQEEELRRLQKENAELKMEREILKKALAIFSKHPK